MRTIVQAGARLHLGFLDLNGGCGRRFGSIGVSLEQPRCTAEAALDPGRATETAEPARSILTRLGPHLGDAPVTVRLAEAIPSHAGFGSGTQHALAIAVAATRAAGRPAPVRDLARWLGRGERSGIGIAAFERGGLVIDAGHSIDDPGAGARRATDGPEPAPVVFQQPLPDAWRFVLATPRATAGLSGLTERRAFRDLPPMDEERVGRICRLTLMQVAPAVLTADIRAFGAAITEIQELVGDYFAPSQGGRFASRTGCEVTDLARARGAHGVGQSSWGPTVFALAESDAQARALANEIRTALGSDLARIDVSGARNRGASCQEVP